MVISMQISNFLSLRPRWYIKLLRYTSPVLLGVGPLLLLVGHSTVIGVLLAIVLLLTTLWFLGWILFVFLTLIIATVKRNFEAGMLLIPLVLGIIGMVEPALVAGMSDMGGRPYHSPLTVLARTLPPTSPLTLPLTDCSFKSPSTPATLKSALTSVAVIELLAGTRTTRCASASEPQV